MKINESELKIMNVLWDNGELSAGDIVIKMKDLTGWNKNTTYTLIKRLIDKGAIERAEPRFMCCPLVERKRVQEFEAEELVDKLFDGSVSNLFSAFFKNEKFDKNQLEELKNLIKEHS